MNPTCIASIDVSVPTRAQVDLEGARGARGVPVEGVRHAFVRTIIPTRKLRAA